jgi:DNA-binding CsgD family transcriptional regulator
MVSPFIIKTHISNNLSKLGVASQPDAVMLALRSGLVT